MMRNSEKPSKAQIQDRIFVSLFPLIVSAIIMFFTRELFTDKLIQSMDGPSIYQTMLGLWGTLLGFIFATAAILVTTNNSAFTQRLKSSGNYKSVLFAYIESCGYIFAALIITTLLYLFNIWNRFCMYIILGESIAVFISVAITVVLFAQIIIKDS